MRIIYIILGLTCLLFFTMCKQEVKPPERQKNISKEARWYGGQDGGCWIKIDSTEIPNQYDVVVYFENDGEIWDKGIFEMCKECNNKYQSIEEIRSDIGAFDGEIVLLNKIYKNKYSCSLEKLKVQK
jgi:hypothetical protein